VEREQHGCATLLNVRSPDRHEQLLEVLGKLAGRIEEQLASIHDRLEHLSEVVREVIEELGILRDIEDEKAADLQWAVRNGQPVFHVTSMPLDPAAPDWGKQLNRYSPADVPAVNDANQTAAHAPAADDTAPDSIARANASTDVNPHRSSQLVAPG
jgi:hypothetical protein